MFVFILHCIFVFNRKLFIKTDGGKTTGPKSFSGPIGKVCKGDVHLMDVQSFVPIPTTLPDLDDAVWKDLSRDQQMLYR